MTKEEGSGATTQRGAELVTTSSRDNSRRVEWVDQFLRVLIASRTLYGDGC